MTVDVFLLVRSASAVGARLLKEPRHDFLSRYAGEERQLDEGGNQVGEPRLVCGSSVLVLKRLANFVYIY